MPNWWEFDVSKSTGKVVFTHQTFARMEKPPEMKLIEYNEIRFDEKLILSKFIKFIIEDEKLSEKNTQTRNPHSNLICSAFKWAGCGCML